LNQAPNVFANQAQEGRARGIKSGNADPSWIYLLLVACAVCISTLAFVYREFLSSGFNLIAGNVGDNRFVIAILEHWRAVIHGKAFFTSPNFFWPEQGVLGYSESMFLFAPPYIAARTIGLDPYLAFELTQMSFKAIGFFSMLWLLRSCIRVTWSTALVGSVLFTLSNLYFISAGHGHLTTVVLVPLLAALLCTGWRSYGGEHRILGLVYGGLFGLLLALVLFTSFYIGWFAALASGVVIVTTFIYRTFHVRMLSLSCNWVNTMKHRAPVLAAALLLFSLAIIPFLITYLPILKQTGGRDFREVLIYSATPIDLLNVGRENWMWGRSLDEVRIWLSGTPMAPSEAQRGWPPLTVALLAGGVFLGFRRQGCRSSPCSSRDAQRFMTAVLSASFVTCWALSLKFGDRSLWWLIFKFVPGSSAIRVAPRFNLVINVLVVVVVCLVLNELSKEVRRSRRIAFWTLSALLIAEQINTSRSHVIRRDSEMAILNRVRRPPTTCASFFLAYPVRRGGAISLVADQIDAMLIARLRNLPTLNGYSGWVPPGWDLTVLTKDYLPRVRRWAMSRQVTTGLCGLDLRDGSWSPVDFRKVPRPFGSSINVATGYQGFLPSVPHHRRTS
jgi:hypothetical protein